MAEVTGAGLYLSDEGGEDWQYQFPHTGLKEGDVIRVGNLSLEVLHTPGHTPKASVFAYRSSGYGETSDGVYRRFCIRGRYWPSGFIGKSCRTYGHKRSRSPTDVSVSEKFAALPDYVQVWPAHGAGSSCGKALGAVSSSTVGYEKSETGHFSMERTKRISLKIF